MYCLRHRQIFRAVLKRVTTIITHTRGTENPTCNPYPTGIRLQKSGSSSAFDPVSLGYPKILTVKLTLECIIFICEELMEFLDARCEGFGYLVLECIVFQRSVYFYVVHKRIVRFFACFVMGAFDCKDFQPLTSKFISCKIFHIKMLRKNVSFTC